MRRTAKDNAHIVRLEKEFGVILPPSLVGFYEPGWEKNIELAADAQPTLITTPNDGIPAYLSMWTDPEVIRVVLQPMYGALIYGNDEVQKGDWVTDTAMFPMVESTGQTSAYDDFSENGMVSVNFQFPQRQSFHYQTLTVWGEKALARMGLAKLSLASELNVASALVLNKFQNQSYIFGIQNLKLFGALTDPALSAYLTPVTKTAGGTGWANATPNEIMADVQKAYAQLQTQGPGLFSVKDRLLLRINSQNEQYLGNTNTFGLTAEEMIKKVFTNLEILGIPEYATPAGNVLQLIAASVQGQKTGYAAYTEKLRAHRVVAKASSFKQKKSQGTWGTIIRQPLGVSQMIGI